jgi:hypothetical protein
VSSLRGDRSGTHGGDDGRKATGEPSIDGVPGTQKGKDGVDNAIIRSYSGSSLIYTREKQQCRM